MTKYDNLTAGTEIYYTGDMANADGYGTITKVREPTRFAPVSYDIAMADGREMRGIYHHAFQPTIGRRFWLKTEHEAERAKRIAEMQLRLANAHIDGLPFPKGWGPTIET